MKRPINLTVAGQELRLLTDNTDEYLFAITAYVEQQIQEILAATRAPISQAAVLACLNIAEELFQAKDMAESLRGQIKAHIDADAKSRAELSELKRENTRRRKTEEMQSL